jgi:hypothetical protein
VDESRFFSANAPRDVLVAGTNVVAVEIHQGSYDSSDLSFDFSLTAQVATTPVILVQPRSQNVLSGNTVVLSASVAGQAPLSFQWWKGEETIAGATNSSLVLNAVTTNDAGSYRVVVTNLAGTATSAVAIVSVIESIDDTFQIVSLHTTGARAIEHAGETGDDRGGIAVSRDRLLVNGDSGTAMFSADDLSGSANLGQLYDGLVSNLRTETIYTLGNGSNPVFGGGTATTLIEIDGLTGQLTTNIINLSTQVNLFSGAVFSGFNRAVVYDGSRVFNLALPSGVVTDLGAMASFPRTPSENWATWGVAEYVNGVVYLVYVLDSQNIVRRAVGSSLTEPVATFNNLSDMASFTVSISRNRWYFHHEGTSQFRAGEEIAGYADATFSFVPVPRAPLILSQPRSQFIGIGSTATLTVRAGGTAPFTYQWFVNDEPIPHGTNATLQLSPVTTADAGIYFVVVENELGSASSDPFTITVGELVREMFDDFEPGIDPVQWSQFSGDVRATNYGGSVSGRNSLWFGGNGQRSAVTRYLDTTGGGVVTFDLRLADGTAFPWERPDGGIALEYSMDEGSNWLNFSFFFPAPGWSSQGENIPSGAQGSHVLFRWRQSFNGGNNFDHWALDDVHVRAGLLQPEILTQPVSQAVPAGNTIFMGVKAVGNPPPTYQWLLNGAPLPDATNSFSQIFNATATNAGIYTVVVSNSEGSVTSSNAVLTVVDPAITGQPQSQDVLGGQVVYFYVYTVGTQPMSLQWLFNGVPLPGETNSFLTITNAGPGHAGRYSVTVSNEFGFLISSNALLRVTDPVILTQPEFRTAILGGQASFSVTVAGSLPIRYQWRHNGIALPGETNNTLLLRDITTNHGGAYSVIVNTAGGAVLSSNATLRVVDLPGDDFRILALRTNNSKVVDHDSLTGDDRGGIAVSSNRVFYTGDNSTARFNAGDLSGGVSLNRLYDGLVSNLRTETVYTLAAGNTPFSPQTAAAINALIELDPNTGTLVTTRRINLSTNIPASYGSGIFSGYDRIVIYNGSRVFHISLPSGVVTDLGPMFFSAQGCENWAFWGVAEFFDHTLYLAHVGYPGIVRTRVPDGLVEPISSFNNLSDMCSFTVSLSMYRWYFHHEGVSQFGGSLETVGYAEGDFLASFPPTAAQVVTQPTGQAVLEGSSAAFQVGVRGSRPLTYQWRRNGEAIPDATNAMLVLDPVTAAQAGAYSVAVSNAYGGAISSGANLVVNPVTTSTFQVAGLFPTMSIVTDFYSLAGEVRGGLALSDTRAFVTGQGTNFTEAGMTASFADENLSGGTSLGRGLNALASNLRTETVYVLANGTTPLSVNGGNVNSIIPLDGATGALMLTNRIVLSSGIALPSFGVGIFSGWDRIVLHTGDRVYQILLPSGQLQLLGTMAPLGDALLCNTWAYWGIAEFFNGAVHLVAVRYDGQTIARTRVPSGQTTTIARFYSLGSMCSITASPFRSRWYFAHPYSSEFGGQRATLGFADAKFIYAAMPPRITSQPQSRGTIEGAGASFDVRAAGGVAQLSYQWRYNDEDIAGATNATFLLEGVSTSHAGQYTVVITNTLGAVTSQVATLTVQRLQGNSFRVTSLSTNPVSFGSPAVWGTLRGPGAVSSTHLFYSVNGATARLRADDVSDLTPVGAIEDGLIGNLHTERVYALADGTNRLGFEATVFSSLIELDQQTMLPTGGSIALSRPIAIPPYQGGIFAGLDRIIIHNGTNVYNIDLASGEVTDLGAMPMPAHQQCNFDRFWGVAEYFDGAVHLLYVRDPQTIARTRVPDGATTTVATFTNTTLCSITFSPSRNRWYFGSTSFGQFYNIVATAEATWDQPNTLPVVQMQAPQPILEDTSLQNLPVTISDAETDPSALAISVASLNPELVPLANIALTGGGNDWILSATPVPNDYGTANIEIAVTDAHGVSVTNRLELVVLPVNDPPAFTRGANLGLPEDAGPQLAPWASAVAAGPANESQSLTFILTVDNPALFATLPAIAPNGMLTFTPAANAHGTANVTIILQDDGGTANGGQDSSPPQVLQIVIQSINDAPSFNKGPDVTLREDDPLQVIPGWATGIRPGPDDESQQSVQFVIANSNPALFEVQPTVSPNGTLSFKPAPNAYGAAQITVVLRDNGGTGNGGSDSSPAQPFTIAVGAVNDAPVANAQSVVVAEGGTVAITLVASDVENDPLTYTVGTSAHGTLSGTPPSLTYTPSANYFGPDSFTFSVNDGEEQSAVVSVTITVTSVNDPPTAAIAVSSPSLLEANGTHYLIIAPDNFSGIVILDASNSWDADSDSLQYLWFANGAAQPFASGARATNAFEIGAEDILLVASDGTDTGTVSVLIDVIAPSHAVEILVSMIDEADMARSNKRPFIASLKAAAASFERGNMTPARNQLHAFQNKVRAQIARTNPVLAAELIDAAQRVLNSLDGP